MFTPATPVNEVGSGDITIVLRLRLDTSTAGDVIAQNYDGSGTADTAAGWSIVNATGTSRRIGLHAPPTLYTAERIDNEANAITLGTDFIIAFRRLSGSWTCWLDADGSGGMTQQTPAINSLDGSTVFSECGDIALGAARDGSTPFDGRIYWIVSFDAAISDADLQLSAWDTESNLKTAWLAAGGTVHTETLTSTIAVTDEPVLSAIRGRVLQDLLTLIDGPTLQSTEYWRILDDQLVITDELIARVVGTITKILTSEVSVTDELRTSVLRFITLTSALQLFDELSSVLTVPSNAVNPVIRIGFDQPRIDVGFDPPPDIRIGFDEPPLIIAGGYGI